MYACMFCVPARRGSMLQGEFQRVRGIEGDDLMDAFPGSSNALQQPKLTRLVVRRVGW